MRNKIIAIVGLLLITWTAQAQTTNYQAYSVFVYGLSKYLSWPPSSKQEFLIAVVGKSKAYDEMQKGLTGKAVNGLPIRVIQIESLSGDLEPNILYISDGKSNMIEELQKATATKPVLIIGEREGLFRRGAGISFTAVDGKLRIDINNQELSSRQIKTSKQLTALVNESI